MLVGKSVVHGQEETVRGFGSPRRFRSEESTGRDGGKKGGWCVAVSCWGSLTQGVTWVMMLDTT